LQGGGNQFVVRGGAVRLAECAAAAEQHGQG
jgi:hypothetical protein